MPKTLLDPDTELQPHRSEVERAFVIPVRTLLDPAHTYLERYETKKRGRMEIPVFEGGPAKVWGLTAYLLDELLRNILVPSVLDAGGEAAYPVRQCMDYRHS
jgi:hypothetical protein